MGFVRALYLYGKLSGPHHEALTLENAAPLVRAQESLPPLLEGANLFFVSTDIPSLLMALTLNF